MGAVLGLCSLGQVIILRQFSIFLNLKQHSSFSLHVAAGALLALFAVQHVHHVAIRRLQESCMQLCC